MTEKGPTAEYKRTTVRCLYCDNSFGNCACGREGYSEVIEVLDLHPV